MKRHLAIYLIILAIILSSLLPKVTWQPFFAAAPYPNQHFEFFDRIACKLICVLGRSVSFQTTIFALHHLSSCHCLLPVCMYILWCEKFASHSRPDSRNVVANFNYFQIKFNDLNFCYQCSSSCKKKFSPGLCLDFLVAFFRHWRDA